MLDKNSKVAIVLPSRQALDLVQGSLVRHKFNKIIQFESVDEAYEVLSRQQVDFLVVSITMPDGPGVTLMQRLLEVGNYGSEPFLFMGAGVDAATLKIFVEYDVDYVLTPPIDKKRVDEKVSFILHRENNVPPDLAMYRDAKGAFQGGIFEMAEDFAKQLLDSSELKEKAKVLLGSICIAQQDLESAKGYFEEVLKGNPGSLGAVHKLAEVLRLMGDFERAKEISESQLEANPLHLNLLKNAGLSNYGLGNLDLAKSQMKRLQSMDKSNKAASETITKVAIDKGEFEGVASQLQASHTEKEIVSMLNSAGIKLSKENNIEGAISIYKDCLSVVRKKDFKGKIHYNLAIAYRRLSKPEKAVKHCQEALRLLPDLEKARAMLGELRQRSA